MLNFGRLSGPAYDLVGVAVGKGVAVGGKGVFVGSGDGNCPICVGVGLVHKGGGV